MAKPRATHQQDVDRLLGHVLMGARGCWPLDLHVQKNGYHKIWLQGTTEWAHIAAWKLLRGPVPEGKELDHLCRNTRCCNPDHLMPKTHRDNVLCGTGPSAIHAQKTHCPKGHEYDHRRPSGKRRCKTCVREYNAAYQSRMKEK